MRRPVASGEYTSAQFHDKHGELALRQSTRRTGIRFDNAAAEAFRGTQRRNRRPQPGRPGRRASRHLDLHRDLPQPQAPAQASGTGAASRPRDPSAAHQGTRPAHTLGVFVARAPGFEVSSRHNPSSRSRTQAMSQRVVQAIMCFWLRPPAFDDLSGGRGPQSALVKRRTSPRRRLDRPLPVGSVLLTGYTTWRDVNRTMSLSGGRRGKQAPQRQPYLFATEPSTPIRRGFPESSPERPLGAALADA